MIPDDCKDYGGRYFRYMERRRKAKKEIFKQEGMPDIRLRSSEAQTKADTISRRLFPRPDILSTRISSPPTEDEIRDQDLPPQQYVTCSCYQSRPSTDNSQSIPQAKSVFQSCIHRKKTNTATSQRQSAGHRYRHQKRSSFPSSRCSAVLMTRVRLISRLASCGGRIRRSSGSG